MALRNPGKAIDEGNQKGLNKKFSLSCFAYSSFSVV